MKTTNMEDKIAIFVLDEDAKKFLLFQQYYETFTTLLNAGVFTIKNGSAVINFDSEGTLKTIQRADVLYNRSSSYPLDIKP